MGTKHINAEYVSERLGPGITVIGNYTSTKMPFKCRCNVCGHEWMAYWGNIKIFGCPGCSRKRAAQAKTLDESTIRDRLRNKKITLLEPYTGMRNRCRLRCLVCGNEWSGIVGSTLQSKGCSNCSRTARGLRSRISHDEIARRLLQRNCELLTDYVGTHSKNKYTVKCTKCGYTRSATIATLMYNGCPKCSGALPKTRHDYDKIAEKFSGKCLRVGINVNKNAMWRCQNGHIFWRSLSTIQRDGTFCNVCSSSRAETICRMALESLFGAQFPKTRIKVPGRRRSLELDGYSSWLKIAFEHQGPHHYQPCRWNGQTLEKAQQRYESTVNTDAAKARYCEQAGIALIIIPELFRKTKLCDLEALIRASTRNGVLDPNRHLNLSELESVVIQNNEPLDRLRSACSRHGFTLINKIYSGSTSRYKARCQNGHIIESLYHTLLAMTHCSLCKRAGITSTAFKAHQRIIREKNLEEDFNFIKRARLSTPKKASEFSLACEPLSDEHVRFIERYEWLGNAGFGKRICFTARYAGVLGGVVLISDHYQPSKISNIECVIQRGACASWTPKNLGSMLIMFACRWMVNNTQKRVFYGYADPQAGEIGQIYQACNFSFLGFFKKQVTVKNGKLCSLRTFRRTNRLLPWLKQQGITLPPSCFTDKGYFIWSRIPEGPKQLLNQRIKKLSIKCKSWIAQHGKYALILGPNRTATKKLKAKLRFLELPYPKRAPA